jgi:hypothetical protein
MARSFFTAANTAAQALVAATAKTALQVKAPTSQRIAIQQISVSFDGTVNTNQPVKVQVIRQTTAGTVSGSAATIKIKDNDIGTAIQSTVQDGFTAEPTYGDQHEIFFVHPQTGVLFPLPIPGEIILAGGGRLGVVCTAPNNVNVLISCEGEE